MFACLFGTCLLLSPALDLAAEQMAVQVLVWPQIFRLSAVSVYIYIYILNRSSPRVPNSTKWVLLTDSRPENQVLSVCGREASG